MSASLVGSEMCIRDSRLAGHFPRCLVRGDVSSTGTTNARPQALQSNPVSYTHLTLPTICSV
eukprot:9406089-Alexandrium_andersonii.AAC.1